MILGTVLGLLLMRRRLCSFQIPPRDIIPRQDSSERREPLTSTLVS